MFRRRVNRVRCCHTIATVFILGMAPTSLSAQKISTSGVGSQFELVFWQSVSTSDDKGQLEAYLARYPKGTFASLARAKIVALERRPARATAASDPDTRSSPLPVIVPTPAANPPIEVVRSAAVDTVMPDAINGGPDVSAAPEPVVAQPAALPPVADPPSASEVAASAPPDVPPTPGVEQGLAEQLRALGQSQGQRPPAPPRNVLPPRPMLISVPSIAPPDRFCSANARNVFYENGYQRSLRIAQSNDMAAVAYLDALGRMRRAAGERGDVALADLIADETQDYDKVAEAALNERERLDAMHDDLMTLPIVDCGADL